TSTRRLAVAESRSFGTERAGSIASPSPASRTPQNPQRRASSASDGTRWSANATAVTVPAGISPRARSQPSWAGSPSRSRNATAYRAEPSPGPGAAPGPGDGLPGAGGQAAADHRDGRVRRDEGRQHVRPAVPAGPVRVPPVLVGGQQLGQGGQQVVVAARAELDQRDARGRVRYEDVQQAVAPAGGGAGEVGAFAGDVPDRLAPAGTDVDDLRLHAPDHRLPVCARVRKCSLPSAPAPTPCRCPAARAPPGGPGTSCSSRPATRGWRAGPPICTATWTPWVL